MKNVLERAISKEDIVILSYDPKEFTDAVSDMIKNETGVRLRITHDYEDVMAHGNYYIRIVDKDELAYDDRVAVEKFLHTDVHQIYEVTMRIIEKLFDGYAVNSYVKQVDTMVHDNLPIIFEFDAKDYYQLAKEEA